MAVILGGLLAAPWPTSAEVCIPAGNSVTAADALRLLREIIPPPIGPPIEPVLCCTATTITTTTTTTTTTVLSQSTSGGTGCIGDLEYCGLSGAENWRPFHSRE
ncbi:MAG: hypothetical protein ACE5E4_04405 [Candidatus Binatia bacterium]